MCCGAVCEIIQKGKASTLLLSFIEYCNKYPDLRFWQALSSWAGFHIFAKGFGPVTEHMDTWEWNSKNGL